MIRMSARVAVGCYPGEGVAVGFAGVAFYGGGFDGGGQVGVNDAAKFEGEGGADFGAEGAAVGLKPVSLEGGDAAGGMLLAGLRGDTLVVERGGVNWA